jgi:hypothetical protein
MRVYVARKWPLRGSIVTRTLNRACVWKWPTTDAMAPEVPWHYALWFFSLGLCQRPGIRPTIATWPRWPKGMDHCSCEEYRCTLVDACVARTWISYRCVPCHPWCTHRTSVIVTKKNFFGFPMAVNNCINLLKPTGYVMYHQFNIQQMYALPTVYLSVLYLPENKQRLVPPTE